ncbi:MAG: hypothetical protein Q8P05_02910 [Candidatus Diapherotrites archaeon]|nr:hypothetical protein [Candidatus Diapherotrites archaeon]MDZ4256730.1 hypothetical protein [archaeon]
MKTMDLFALALALIVGGGLFYYLIYQPYTETPATAPTWTIDAPSSVGVGESFNLTITLTGGDGQMLTLQQDEKESQSLCSGDPCIVSFPLRFDAAGLQILIIRLGQSFRQVAIPATQTGRVCLDATLEGQCSQTLPYRCSNTHLIVDCDRCGCPKGLVCTNTECVAPPLSLTISALLVDEVAYSTRPVSLTITIHNDTEHSVEDIFLFFIDALDNNMVIQTTPQTAVFTLPPQGNQSFTFSFRLPENTQALRARLHENTPPYSSDHALATSEDIPIHVIIDNDPPAPPTGLTFQNPYLEWVASISPDTEVYIIYQQDLAAGGFTTYSIFGETPDTHYLLPPQLEARAYVIRARDHAGNLGSPSDPLLVPATP